MTLLESIPIKCGTKMPSFSLQDPYGKIVDSEKLNQKKGLLIFFTCNHCPYALAIWPRVIRLSQYASSIGIETVAINPNIHPHYPEDRPEAMQEKIEEWRIPFPYLIDIEQNTAKAFQATCTPDLYLLDQQNILQYHGRCDDNWKEEEKVSKKELKQAINQLANNENIDPQQFPSIGCSIKWKTS